MVFNLLLAVGMRDLVVRLLARKRIREFAFLVLVMGAASLQFLVARNALGGGLRVVAGGDVLKAWPWTAAANLAQGREVAMSLTYLLAWCVIGSAFGLWQFSRTLSFDQRRGRGEPIAQWGPRPRQRPADRALLPSALGSMCAIRWERWWKKRLRFLARSPRFRLVFLMGFTFGLVIWLPVALGRSGATQSFLGSNYLTVVSVYSLLLLSEVCFWNSFGFDRSAAQIYFLAPVPFSKRADRQESGRDAVHPAGDSGGDGGVRGAGHATGSAETGRSVRGGRGGQHLSVRRGQSDVGAAGARRESRIPRSAPARPDACRRFCWWCTRWRSCRPGWRTWRAMRFNSEAAFFAVLAFDAAVGGIVYRIALESAVESAVRMKEKIVERVSGRRRPNFGLGGWCSVHELTGQSDLWGGPPGPQPAPWPAAAGRHQEG